MVKLLEKIRDFFSVSNLVLAFEEHKRSPRTIEYSNDPLFFRILNTVFEYRDDHLIYNIGKEIHRKNFEAYAKVYDKVLKEKTNTFIDGLIKGFEVKGYKFSDGIVANIKRVSNLSNLN